MKVKFMVTGLATIALFSTIMIEHSRISHLTHLSGMISGYIYLKKDFLVTIINNYFNSKKESTKIFHIKTKMDEEVILKKTVNEVLDKLNESGLAAARVCIKVDLCEYITPFGLPVVPEV